jgi:single-stranded DNA-binding protein
MNDVFLTGKIINDVKFKFIINSKNISIAVFNIETNDKQVIKIKAYNELADYCYSKLETRQRVFIYGEISENDVIVKEIYQY